jgi:hypothetical protein
VIRSAIRLVVQGRPGLLVLVLPIPVGWSDGRWAARKLLAAERERIERALRLPDRQDDGEPADTSDPGNLASDLAQAEFDEGFEKDLRDQLAAVERAENVLPPERSAFRSRADNPSRTSVWRPSRPPSTPWKRSRAGSGVDPTLTTRTPDDNHLTVHHDPRSVRSKCATSWRIVHQTAECSDQRTRYKQ